MSDERERLDMPFVLRSLANAYWADDRPPGLTERSWAHCLPLGLYAPGGGMSGFCRVMTDYAFRAHLADVFIHPDARGTGLGKALVAATLAHPELATVHKWTLNTRDAHGLYAQFGFRPDHPGDHAMALDRTGAS